jgi:hypothetical protein
MAFICYQPRTTNYELIKSSSDPFVLGTLFAIYFISQKFGVTGDREKGSAESEADY